MLALAGISSELLGLTVLALLFWVGYIGATVWIPRYGRWSRASFVGLLVVGLVGTPLLSGIVLLVVRGRQAETSDQS